MKTLVLASLMAVSVSAFAGDGSLPSGPEVMDGQCWTHQFTEPTFETSLEKFKVQDAYTEYNVTPVVLETVTGSITVTDGPHWKLGACEQTGEETVCYHDGKLSNEFSYNRVVTPASVEVIEHEAIYDEVKTVTFLTPGSMEWVLGGCDASILPVEKSSGVFGWLK